MYLSELCAEYHMSIQEIKQLLVTKGFFLFGPNPELTKDTERQIRETLKDLQQRQPVTQPSPKPIQNRAPKPYSNIIPESPTKYKDVEEKRQPTQSEMLSRDYVIFTNVALRKPQTEAILFELVQNIALKHSQTKIVVCSGAIEHMQAVAQSDIRHRPMAEDLDALRKANKLTVLRSTVATENYTLSTFLRDKKKMPFEKSVLIIGYNRALAAYVEYRNSQTPPNCPQILIMDVRKDKDDRSKAYLTPLEAGASVFFPPYGKNDADFSTEPRSLHGIIPVEGDTVYIKTGTGDDVQMIPVKLEKEINHGAEGAVYKVTVDGQTKCAKLFFNASNTEMKFRKIRLMRNAKLRLDGADPLAMDHIAWPEKILITSAGDEIGYTMKFFEGTVQFSDFDADSIPRLIPGCNRLHQVTMAVNLAALIEFLHANNVILCDINRGNVLIDPKELQVYLVDLDSAQFADKDVCYPSNVAWPEYLSPEHIKDDDYAFRHTKADDVWILQMLLFRMLTPAFTSPYMSSVEVDDDNDYTEKGMYPFQYGDHRAEPELRGTVYHKVVSSFPNYIKGCFWESFHGSGKYFRSNTRRDAHYWLRHMVSYQLDLPHLIEQDAEYGKLWPEYIKRTDPTENDSGSHMVINNEEVRANSGRIAALLERLARLDHNRQRTTSPDGNMNEVLRQFRDPKNNKPWD